VHLGVGIAVTFALYFTTAAMISEDAGRQLDSLIRQVVRRDSSLPYLAVAILIFAPLWEEFLHRGFLFKGIEGSPLRWPGAVVITALAFAAIHFPDGPIQVARMFILGLALGAMRAWSGSTWLTIGMHALWNAIVLSSYLFFKGG